MLNYTLLQHYLNWDLSNNFRPWIMGLFKLVSFDFLTLTYFKRVEWYVHQVCLICSRVTEVAELFLFALGQLGADAYDGDEVWENLLIGEYHGVLKADAQRKITLHYANPLSKCRIMFATIGFGMGVDMDIAWVIHWGISTKLQFLWQVCSNF